MSQTNSDCNRKGAKYTHATNKHLILLRSAIVSIIFVLSLCNTTLSVRCYQPLCLKLANTAKIYYFACNFDMTLLICCEYRSVEWRSFFESY